MTPSVLDDPPFEKFSIVSFEDHPVRIDPDGNVSARDLFLALGKVRSTFSTVLNRHPSLRNYVREYRFDRRGPRSYTITRAGVDALEHFMDATPSLERFKMFLDARASDTPDDTPYSALVQAQTMLHDVYSFLKADGLSIAGGLSPKYNRLITRLEELGVN